MMRDIIHALFDGPYLTLGMTGKALSGIQVPGWRCPAATTFTPGVGRRWSTVRRPTVSRRNSALTPESATKEPEKYVERVLQFLAWWQAGGYRLTTSPNWGMASICGCGPLNPAPMVFTEM